MFITLPSTESLQHWAEIAKRLLSLRHVLPRVPLWKLAAHRIPTLWTLYRGLLRHVQHHNVRVATFCHSLCQSVCTGPKLALQSFMFVLAPNFRGNTRN